MDKIDQVIMGVFWVAIIAITISAMSITWSVSRTKQLEDKVKHLESEVDVLGIRYTNLTAWLQAHGIEVSE